MRKVVTIVSLFAGGGDFASGLLLVLAPQAALRLMRVPSVSDLVWVQFVGVFVGCVGLSYLLGLIAWKITQSSSELRTVWKLTAIIRLAAASFVITEIGLGRLDHAWISVPCTDLFWACIQLAVLARGFPEE